MKRLFTILIALAMFASCAAALAEEAPLHLGYITQAGEADRWHSLCAGAFAYAAEQNGAVTTILTYDPAEEETSEDAESEEPMPLGLKELVELIEAGVDGVAVAPASLEQAQALIAYASEAGVPIVIEGLDVSSAYPLAGEAETDPDALRPYVAAVGYGDSAAYAASKWLEDRAYNPMMMHCALHDVDSAGMRRALSSARYLSLAHEIDASEDSVQAGRDAVGAMYSSFTMFGCVLADSVALAEGCAAAIQSAGDNYPVAAIASSPEALELLRAGKINMVAAAPASVEGVQTFKALFDFVSDGTLPETETGFVQLNAITATVNNTSAWIDSDDFEAAYALVYPELAEDSETDE